MALAFGLLGPFEMRVADQAVPVRSPKHRILLATLVLRTGRVVPVGELVEAMWDARQPESPRRAVQLAVTRLRALLDEAGCSGAIVTDADGYLIDVPPERIDVERFRRGLADADRAAERSDPVAEAAALHAALSQWRGNPLIDVPSDILQQRILPRLREQRLYALERRFDVDLRLGRHERVVEDLVQATVEHPLRERFWVQLMTALHRSGRRGDALTAYHDGRRHLAEELGIDPGEEMRQVHAAILGGFRSPATGTMLLPAVPRQLPPEVSGFTGRDREIDRLDALLCGSGPPATIIVISGTAGVGKTSLALHWARRAADRFPDGQLWVNLRGYDHRPAMTPGQALTLFLRALGVPGEAIPSDLESQAGLYRSLMDGRRVLVVIDNASAADQVRPLLPGGPGSAAIVTTRNMLTGLVAVEGAHPVELGLFTGAEGHELLTRRLGAERVQAAPTAAREIVERCAGLPLALALVAARATQRPALPLAALAGQLRAARDRLDEFASPDTATDVRAIFCYSYQTLSEPAMRLFRLLGLHPGPDIAVDALTSLAGLPPAELRPLLAELTTAHLVTEHVDGRWTLHDLLRAYAIELAHANDTATDRDTALRRLLDHYVHTGHAAALLIEPLREPVPLAPADPAVWIRPPAGREEALAWFGAEYTGLLAAIERAGRATFDTHTWQLVWTLADFQQWRGLWHDRAASLQAALEATRRLDHRAEQARAHRGLGYAYTRLHRNDDAQLHLRHALALYTQLDDPLGQGRTHHGLSYVLERRGDPRAALWHAQRALDLFPPDGNRAHRARALGTVGWCHGQLGDHRQSLHVNQEALELLADTGDRVAEAATWDSIGYAHHHLGEYPKAIKAYQTALRLRREVGHRYGIANTLDHLGDTYQTLGDTEAARRAWRDALDLLEQLREPDAERVHAKLRRHDTELTQQG
ncbi:BTAD domain-containing putative transcriptional regulator [Micromonospora sp. WMMD1102]|uniref:AfsR/SARP family transcriptional regulator n=1 Tax=Micromonospora sp. WMMD1102 TaxID=3016105 RepID=UPI00241550F9|nr:BTAD domain-containing putative transcriptional regulator [Micromonospora sp. WMMD1102]MDG4791764.1 BTAD domain-containing putative transcriptional regulator [Micromonospora sp. WMMD1102]